MRGLLSGLLWLRVLSRSRTRFAKPPVNDTNPVTSSPETPRKKKLKDYTPGPDPKFLEKNSQNSNNTRKILSSGIFSIFEFFIEVGVRGVIFEVFFEEFRGSGFWIPVAGRACLKTQPRIAASIAFLFCVFLSGFRQCSTTIVRLSFLGGFEQGG